MRGQLAEMQTEQRPWISLDMQAEGPLAYDANGWHFVVKYSLNNVGKSPAVSMDFIATMMPLGDPQSNPPNKTGYSFAPPTKAINTATEATCGEQERWRGYGWGEIMFPNIPQTRQWRAHSYGGTTGFIPGFIIIGCATYKFVGDDITHKAWRIFELGGKAYGKMINLSEETIQMESLAFFPYPEHGSYAN